MTKLRCATSFLAMSCALFACTGDKGAKGDKGDPGNPAPTTGTITGTVTDGVAHDALSGVAVTAADAGGATLATATTGADGSFSVTIPAGPVDLSFAKDLYTAPGVLHSGVSAGTSVTLAVTMNEAASGAPSVLLAVPGDDFGYGAQVPLSATAADPNGDTLTYAWSNTTDPLLDSDVVGTDQNATATLPSMAQAFSRRQTANGMWISGYQLDGRFGVIPIMTDTRGQMTAKLVVSDGRGQSTSASVTLNAASLAGGVPAVALGQRIYLSCGSCAGEGIQWSVTPAENTELADATSATPSFRAAAPGKYTLTEASTNKSIDIYVDKYYGMVAKSAESSDNIDQLCTACHGRLEGIPNRFTEYNDPLSSVPKTGWLGTAHATTFAEGVNGTKSNHFNGSCAGCHTTGYDGGIANGGFADMAAQYNWRFPSTFDPSNWETMLTNFPAVARLANIQCESCHGPQGDAVPLDGNAHGTTALLDANGQPLVVNGKIASAPFQSKRISYAAEVCGACHAAGGDHIYTEWATPSESGMAHSNRGGAALAASTSLNTSCGRCHSSQGYTLYSAGLKADTPIVTLTCKPASAICDQSVLPATATLGMVTAANVQPVTCSGCHDPHDGSNPSQLRIYNDLAMTPAGFGVAGMGKGALCISCHNSRNGTIAESSTFTYLHEDTETYNGGAPTGYSAPHQADQGDVFVGRNAYFMGASLPMTSKHAAVADTCVGCHMTLQPETFPSFGGQAKQTHLFRITDANEQQLCANCHGSAVNGQGIQGQVENQLEALNVKLSQAFITKMTGTTFYVCAYDEGLDQYTQAAGGKTCTSANLAIDLTAAGGNAIAKAELVEIHGQVGLDVTLAKPISITYVDSNGANPNTAMRSEFQVQLGNVKNAAQTAIYALTGNYIKAGWNYFLIEGDQSKGLHNPSFVTAVLNASLAKDVSN